MRIISQHKKTVAFLAISLIVVFVLTLKAGDLNPPGAPTGTMRTLNEIYAAAFEPVSVPSLAEAGIVSDCFLSLSDIPGESTDSNHTNWIEPHGYTLHVENGAEPKANPYPKFSNLLVSKRNDSASVPLMLKCCNNSPISQVILELAKPGGAKTVYYRLTLTDARVTYISPMSARTSYSEVVSFGSFDTIKWEYRALDPATGQPGPWQSEQWDVGKEGGES